MGVAAVLAEYLEAAVFRDYRLFNRRREVSFRKKLCRVTGHREVVFKLIFNRPRPGLDPVSGPVPVAPSWVLGAVAW